MPYPPTTPLWPPACERWLRLELPARSDEAEELIERLRRPFNGFWLAAKELRGASLIHDEGTRLRRPALILTPKGDFLFGIAFRKFGAVEIARPRTGLAKMRVIEGDRFILMAGALTKRAPRARKKPGR